MLARSGRAGRGGERGFALLIVLWGVVLLALLATGITAAGRTDVQLAANLRGEAEAEMAADGGVSEGVFHLLDAGRAWRADGAAHEVRVPGGRVVVRVMDEAGKVNPNTASPELLRALLAGVGADAQTAERVAGAMADWRFPGTLPRAGGAKASQYRAAGLAYGPPGAPFESLEELGAVLGMTPALLAALLPHVSLLNDREPSLREADPVVVQAMRAVFGPQRAEGGAEGEAGPVRSVTITSAAVMDGGARFVRQAAVRLGGEKERLFEVLSWSRG